MAAEHSLRTEVQRYCAVLAQDRLLVQAAGGNVSWKTSDTLWIKASGTWLADAEQKDIFVPVDRPAIATALALGDFAFSPQARDGYTLRPSIETMLHALMPHQFVVHLHPVDAMTYLARGNCGSDLQAALGSSLDWGLVDYYKPGADLAASVRAKLKERPGIQVLLLKNHGVILGAETIDEIDARLRTLCECLGQPPRPLATDTSKTHRFEAALKGAAYQACTDPQLHSLATDPELYTRLGDSWAICPDHVVFLGAKAVCIDDLSVLPHVLRSEPPAPFIFVKHWGLLESRDTTAAQRAQLSFYLDVMVRNPIGQRLDSLSAADIASLLGWEAEKYRLKFNQMPS